MFQKTHVQNEYFSFIFVVSILPIKKENKVDSINQNLKAHPSNVKYWGSPKYLIIREF